MADQIITVEAMHFDRMHAELRAAIPALVQDGTVRYSLNRMKDGTYFIRLAEDIDQRQVAAVIAAHDPTPDATPTPPDATPTPPDFGDDAPDDYRARAADAVVSLRAYLRASSPTGAQTVAALKVLIRLVLFLARRSL